MNLLALIGGVTVVMLVAVAFLLHLIGTLRHDLLMYKAHSEREWGSISTTLHKHTHRLDQHADRLGRMHDAINHLARK